MNAEYENEEGTKEVNREGGNISHHKNRLRLGTFRPYYLNHLSFGSV